MVKELQSIITLQELLEPVQLNKTVIKELDIIYYTTKEFMNFVFINKNRIKQKQYDY